MKITIKAWAAIRNGSGMIDAFEDIRTTQEEALLVAKWRRRYNEDAYRYSVVPVVITYLLAAPKSKRK